MSEETNRNLPARNTPVQLLALYTDSESHNGRRYRQTDGRRDDANSRSYCVAVRSADETDVNLTTFALLSYASVTRF